MDTREVQRRVRSVSLEIGRRQQLLRREERREKEKRSDRKNAAYCAVTIGCWGCCISIRTASSPAGKIA